MRASWHAIWGCARGPALRLAPHVRIVVGTGLLTACLLAPATSWPGVLLALGSSCGWLCVCWPHWRTARSVLVFGSAALLSYLAFAFLLVLATGAAGAPLAPVLAKLLVGGSSTLLVSVASITALSMADLQQGLVRLPVPRMAAAIFLQIVHQTATLVYETGRVASAMAVRDAASGGVIAWKVLSSLPRVWLPRIVQRADRVAAAMELRGYCEALSGVPGESHLCWPDFLALAMTAGVLAASLLLRCWRPS